MQKTALRLGLGFILPGTQFLNFVRLLASCGVAAVGLGAARAVATAQGAPKAQANEQGGRPHADDDEKQLDIHGYSSRVAQGPLA